MDNCGYYDARSVYLKHKFNNNITLTTINAMDVFRRTTGNRQYYQRITNGGRIEYTQGSIYGTVNAYYQYGQNASSGKITRLLHPT